MKHWKTVAHMYDIWFDALCKLDAPDLFPFAVVRGTGRVADRQPEELGLLMIAQRLPSLERTRDEYSESLTRLAIDVLGLKEQPPLSSRGVARGDSQFDNVSSTSSQPLAMQDDSNLTSGIGDHGNKDDYRAPGDSRPLGSVW